MLCYKRFVFIYFIMTEFSTLNFQCIRVDRYHSQSNALLWILLSCLLVVVSLWSFYVFPQISVVGMAVAQEVEQGIY